MTDGCIPAATILLLRDDPAFEVLMVKRHADIAFAGGAMVFPGGRIEESDRDARWGRYCAGYEDIDMDQRGPRVAAIREAFEETGVLLAMKDNAPLPDVSAFASDRKVVEDNDAAFYELVRDNELVLTLDALHLYARWRPPAGVAHRRYDTWFFAATSPVTQEASPDGGEATEVVWAAPADVLMERDAGRRRMIFPTSRNLELLAKSDSAGAVFAYAAERPIRPVEPRIVARDGAHFLTIPNDLGYPVTEEALEAAMRG